VTPSPGARGFGVGPRAAAVWGSLLLAAAIGIGAFGAHTLEGRVTPARLETLETAVRYQAYGSLGLLAIAALGLGFGAAGHHAARTRLLRVGAGLLLCGVLVFSLTLFGLVAGGPGVLGAITPLGGALMIAAWVVVAVAFARQES